MKKVGKKLAVLFMAFVVAISTAPSMSVFSASNDNAPAGSIKRDVNSMAKDEKENAAESKDAVKKAAADTSKPKPRAGRAKREVSGTGIWINEDQSKIYNTLKEAAEKAKLGDTIHVKGDFSGNTAVAKNAVIDKAVTLNIAGNTTFKGDGSNGITLSDGAKIKAEKNTLTMSGFDTAISVKKNSAINDGKYILDGNKKGFALMENGKIDGTARDNLTISAKNSSGNGYSFTEESRFKKCTVEVQVTSEKGESYAGLYMEDASLTTRGVWYYFDPQKDKGNKGGIHLDHSDFYVYKATGSYNYKQTMAVLGDSELKNGSTLTGDGSRITLSAKMTVKDSKVTIKNSSDGGLNINYKPAEAIFENSTLETTNMKYTPSYGTGQSDGPCHLTFKGDSVVNTDAKDKTADNGGANRGTGSTYVVTGGSFLLAYDPSYNYNVTTPTNGVDNGDEFLTLFTLKDSSINELNPINKNGNTYAYSVKSPSKDGKKHVWTPAAKVTFDLNNNDATFADGKTDQKSAKTIRGYRLDDVEGNEKPGVPKDKNNVKFLGWFYKDANGQEHEFKWDEKLTADLNVYAKWDSKRIIYHNGEGKNYIFSVDKNKTEATVFGFDEIVKKDDTFSVPGKKFKYWTDDAAGNGKRYSAGDLLKFSGNENIDLYAQYDQEEYKVSFSANGGTFAADSIFKTRTDVFTIEKDANGGEVAVLKKTAKYGNKLRSLLNGMSHNDLKPDTKASKPGYLLKDSYRWATSPDGSGIMRFDDYKSWLWNIDGANPEITKDTTYYQVWKEDPAVQKIKQDSTIKGDIWSKSREDSSKTHILYGDKKFSITGDLDASDIKAQMKKIEDIFNKHEGDFDKISLTEAKSTFTATITVPDGIKIPKNPDVKVSGLGDAFEMVDTKVAGQKIIVTFKLKSGMTDYKKLKDAVSSVGVDGTSLISATISGFELDDKKVTNGQKLTVRGEVKGDFSAIAKDNASIKSFNFNWTAEQSDKGKDVEAKDNTSIQHTFIVSKPIQLTLGGDLLVKKGNDKFNTEHDAIYPADEEDSLTFNGRLNVSSIKRQIEDLKNGYGGNADKITTENVKSEFTATLTLPKDMNSPEDVVAKLTDNNLFEVKKVEKNGNKITVTMGLKKSYAKFKDLYDDVKSVSDELDLEIPNITLKTNVDGNKKLTVVGELKGTFVGEATAESGKTKPFNYQWTAEQTDEGKDFIIRNEVGNKTIQLTVKTPERIKFQEPLPGDLLVGNNTEHDGVHYVKAGDKLAYTGRLDVSPIVKKIDDMKNRYAGNADKITTKDIESTFVATLTIPEGLNIPDNVEATLTDNNLFKIVEVKRQGRKITVKMSLKKDYSKFMDLYNDVKGVPGKLDVTLSEVTVDKSLSNGQKLTTAGTVEGTFKGKAFTESGTVQKYDFSWTGEQEPSGLDFFLRNASSEDKKKIQYTVVVINPMDLTLEGDILIGNDTEHDAIFRAKQGQSLTYTGRLDVRPIKAHIKNLKAHYGGNSDKIKLNGVSSTFKAVMTFDKGLDIPENPKLTLTDNNLFEIKKIEKSGQSVTVTMALKKNYSKFSELYKDVTEVPDDLDLNIENVTVNKNVKVGTKLKTVGDVNGMFTGEAVTESGNYQHFDFNWKTQQSEAGKDFTLRNEPDNKTIQFTLEVVSSKTPTPDPGDKPSDKPKKPDNKPDKPAKKPDVKKPKTGDESNLSIYAGLMGISLLALAFAIRRKLNK